MGDDELNYNNLRRRPSFLIRRLHQIHLALFALTLLAGRRLSCCLKM
jgi:hypothetical protein